MTISDSFFLPDKNFWYDKRVLITGHTGFKGSWLSLWLSRLGAKVVGLSLEPSCSPSLYYLANVESLLSKSFNVDIRDYDQLRKAVNESSPHIVIHLAAQSLVLSSYDDPLKTFSTNTLGTANLLNALRGLVDLKVIVCVTTDKVYENPENSISFLETDPLGGFDPYSASKAASEIIISSFRRSFFSSSNSAIASARAGNVIGGGDWSANRLLPDAFRAWSNNLTLKIRNPDSVRPWQHVLDPLAGYLCLCEKLWLNKNLSGSFNFGPAIESSDSVRNVISIAREIYGSGNVEIADVINAPHEASFLHLNASKASKLLGFNARLDLTESVRKTVEWFKAYEDGHDPMMLCMKDIEDFYLYN